MGTEVKKTAPFLTSEETTQIAILMGKKYQASLGNRHFEIDVKKDNAGVYAQVLLRNNNGSYYYPVEGRVAAESHDLNAREAVLLLLDYIDSYFDEYFREGGDVYLPI